MLEQVGEDWTIDSAAALRQHFTRAVSATPLAYRRTFRP